MTIDDLFVVIGEAGLSRVVAGFYRRVPADDILGPMYPPDDLANAEARLRGFLLYRIGGPPTYLAERGHPRLRMRHMPFAIDTAARNRWTELMDAAIDEAALPAEAAEVLRSFLHDVATSMINR